MGRGPEVENSSPMARGPLYILAHFSSFFRGAKGIKAVVEPIRKTEPVLSVSREPVDCIWDGAARLARTPNGLDTGLFHALEHLCDQDVA
jgi:hypothetical protein